MVLKGWRKHFCPPWSSQTGGGRSALRAWGRPERNGNGSTLRKKSPFRSSSRYFFTGFFFAFRGFGGCG
jgi:hypothetical protein